MPTHAGARATEGMVGSFESAEFERLYRLYRPWLVQYCRRRLGSHGDAEGIAQEAFARAWATADRYQGARFRGWLATIAARLCVTTFRRAAVERHYRGAIAARDEQPAPDTLVELKEEARLALRALDRVPARYQRILILHYLDGWSYQEIARAENLSLEAVRGRMRRARTSLRESYARLVQPGVPAVVRWWRSLRDRLPAPGMGFDRLLTACARLGQPVEVAAVVVAVALAVAAAPSAVVPEGGIGIGSVAIAAQHDARPVTGTEGPGPRVDQPTAVSPRPHSPVDMAVPALQPEPVDESDTTVFQSFTASPDYERDGTVFAVGQQNGRVACVPLSCLAVFRTTDRGKTWQKLPAVGYVSGPLHLTPNYPADPRIFAFGAGVLSVSHDGGLSFVPVGGTINQGASAAVSPDFATDGLILLGQRAFEYRDHQQAVVPVLSPQSGSVSYLPLFSPGYRTDRTLFELAGRRLDRCVTDVCRNVATFPGEAPRLVDLASRHVRTGRVAAAGYRTVYVSATGDGDFRTASPLPLDGSVTDIAFDTTDRLFVGMWTVDETGNAGGLAVSDDDGRSWRVLGAGTPLERGVFAVQPLADGRILASSGHNGGSLWCSVDDGLTWHPRCAT